MRLTDVVVRDTNQTTGGLDLNFVFDDGESVQGVTLRPGETPAQVCNKLHTLSQIIKRAHEGTEG